MSSYEHQNLVNIIRGVHEHLRRAVAFSHNPDKVWAEHLREQDLRKKYSLAMFKLATEIWKGKECRIEWMYETILIYFFNGGLNRSLIREMKIANKKQYGKAVLLENFEDVIHQNSYMTLNRKLRLLDVGSCYNPFSKFNEFDCVAIDLTPATKEVLELDFLSVEIKPNVQEKSSDVSNLFLEKNFDIVVLSLVLEYLPAPKQRAIFCYKSWQLLQENGLCLIITPDSKSVNHNVHMIKSWKLALEEIGFVRVKYDKLQHLHCMAFRKLKKDDNNINLNLVSNFLYIPQDFTEYCDENTIERNDEENYNICNNFSELPNENIL